MPIKNIFCGHRNGYITMGNGETYAFGTGTSGELGIGFIEHKSKSLKKLFIVANLKMVSAGSGGHCFAISDSNECYSWGNCHYGKIGPEAAPSVTQLFPERTDFFND